MVAGAQSSYPVPVHHDQQPNRVEQMFGSHFRDYYSLTCCSSVTMHRENCLLCSIAIDIWSKLTSYFSPSINRLRNIAGPCCNLHHADYHNSLFDNCRGQALFTQ